MASVGELQEPSDSWATNTPIPESPGMMPESKWSELGEILTVPANIKKTKTKKTHLFQFTLFVKQCHR